MLLAITTVKLIAEIALLALLGQWILGLLAGAKKDSNLFYQILEVMGRPFVTVARLVSPKVVLDRHVPLVAFLLVGLVWFVATVLKIQTCLQIGVTVCQ
jgi:hypothetical protein